MEPLCHRGVATSRNATCFLPGTAPPNPTTRRADDRRRRLPAPRPSSTLPSLSLFLRITLTRSSHLPQHRAREEEPVSAQRAEVAGRRRRVTCSSKKPLAARGRREWRLRQRLQRQRRRGTRSTTTDVWPSGRRCRGAPSAPAAAAPRCLDLPVSTIQRLLTNPLGFAPPLQCVMPAVSYSLLFFRLRNSACSSFRAFMESLFIFTAVLLSCWCS